jgi:glyoxylase-like metal-dependent hydrolase (beta-lactamase superfamily II)
MAPAAPAREVAAGVTLVRDTCNVYVLRTGREAVLIDFGAGAVLDHLDELGIDRVTDVLLTHHHRDQAQGLARAVEHGANVWVPPVEEELVAGIDERWQTRKVANDYDVRQDRFSLLGAVAVAGTVAEYRAGRYGGFDVFTLPTPGHTVGSVTYLVEVDGRRLAFSGDLLYGAGKVWSLAATQWTYSGVEGQVASILSLAFLAEREPDLLLPSHGEPIEDPQAALTETRARLTELMELRREGPPWRIDRWLHAPWEVLSPHLLRNRTSIATSYALLSDSGGALLFDFGYDYWTGLPLGGARSANRPLLGSIFALRRDFGVERIEAAVTTHYHDDHVAGLNLLRDVEGTEVWSPENVAPILEDPTRYDLPCVWFDPIPVDRRLALREPIAWHEYELTAYPLPGHTLYAAAIAFEADGRRIVATGDQQALAGGPDGPDILNYQYRNRFRYDDYVASAELYRSLSPDLLITGHWPPREVTDAYLDRLLADGRRLAELHRRLLPVDEVDFGAEGFGARIEPYRSSVRAGENLDLDVAVRNPFDRDGVATVRLVVPAGWEVTHGLEEVSLGPNGEEVVRFRVRPVGEPVRRARVAADLTVDGVPFGQQAEALVDVT